MVGSVCGANGVRAPKVVVVAGTKHASVNVTNQHQNMAVNIAMVLSWQHKVVTLMSVQVC